MRVNYQHVWEHKVHLMYNGTFTKVFYSNDQVRFGNWIKSADVIEIANLDLKYPVKTRVNMCLCVFLLNVCVSRSVYVPEAFWQQQTNIKCINYLAIPKVFEDIPKKKRTNRWNKRSLLVNPFQNGKTSYLIIIL